MKTFSISITNKEQERLFTNLANELGINFSITKFKPLSGKEVALGTGKKFSDEQLAEYLVRNSGGKPKTAANTRKDLAVMLSKKAER